MADPVFITARFRSGSTLIWDLFRHVPGCTAYYEPLHPRPGFDPARRIPTVDPTHHGVDDYWREYDGLEALQSLFDPHWHDRGLFMDAAAHAPALRAYVQALIDHANGQAVLQFNRIDFRLPWFRHAFPTARIIHLHRNPRDQWCSALDFAWRRRRHISVAKFARADRFFLLPWARDLQTTFPCLDPAGVDHPYDLSYMIAKLSFAYGSALADASFAYEDLVAAPRSEITRLLSAASIDDSAAILGALAARVVANPPEKWRTYAPAEWFEEREARCDARLAQAGAGRPFRPGSVRRP